MSNICCFIRLAQSNIYQLKIFYRLTDRFRRSSTLSSSGLHGKGLNMKASLLTSMKLSSTSLAESQQIVGSTIPSARIARTVSVPTVVAAY
jgi:hypothetical protein